MAIFPWAIQYTSVTYLFLNSSLYLLTPYPYPALHPSLFPTGNYYFVLYICEYDHALLHSFICYSTF